MLKTVSTTIILVALSPAYTLAYAVANALKLKDRELMETPLDFILMAIDDYGDQTFEARYMKKLTKQVEQFYHDAMFIPAPAIIDLYDCECVARIVDDMKLLGENEELINELQNL